MDPSVAGFHDLRLIGHGRRVKAVFDISVDDRVRESRYTTVKQRLIERLADSLPWVQWSITVEPRFKYSAGSTP